MKTRRLLWLMGLMGVLVLLGHSVVAKPITSHIVASGVTDPGYPPDFTHPQF